MNLAATASLAVASLDLLLVQDLIGAIRAADAGAKAEQSSPFTPLPTPAPHHHFTQDFVTWCEPHACAANSPCYQKRTREVLRDPIAVPHARERVALKTESGLRLAIDTADKEKTAKIAPIQPPWAVRVWNEPIKPAARIKVVQYRTDIVSKGSLIDMFI